MKENTLTIKINKSAAEVFNFTINPKNTHLWIDFIAHEKVNTDPIALGTTYRNQNQKGDWSSYEVVEFIPNKFFRLKSKDKDYSVRYTYTPISKNQSELEYHEWAEKE